MARLGVNLGGWLVLERWITPGLFAGTDAQDEYEFMQLPGARPKLRDHQKNFIREEDFQWLARHAVRLVRIPVGYWVFEGDKPHVSCVGRLDWAFRMAAKHQIDLIISLHGAPGGQNGQDHSGHIGQMEWYRDAAARARTIECLERLAKRYGDQPAFWGLELLNEPSFRWRYRRTLRRFYRESYELLSGILAPTTRIIFSDAFRPRLWSGTLTTRRGHPVMMDIHWYHFTTWAAKWLSLQSYYQLLSWRRRTIRRLRRWQEIIIGEWSGAFAQEVFNRYDSTQHHQLVLEHIQRQMAVYAEADAWCYWTYRHEKGGIWSLRYMVDKGGLTLHSAGKATIVKNNEHDI